ncbi:MAG: hypothetical protein AB7L41_03180 [Flavobacteriaceae bacterium]
MEFFVAGGRGFYRYWIPAFAGMTGSIEASAPVVIPAKGEIRIENAPAARFQDRTPEASSRGPDGIQLLRRAVLGPSF